MTHSDPTRRSSDRLSHLVADYVGQGVGKAEIDAILARITQYFIDRGLVTTRAYIPPQDLRTGLLKLAVVEGKVEDIRPADGASLTSGQLITAFPGLRGERPNLRDFEQGIDQIKNRKSDGEGKGGSVRVEPGG